MATHRRTFLTGRGIAIRAGGAPGPEAPAGAVRGPGYRELTRGAEYREIDLFSGTMHYWRLDRADWGACLEAMKRLGLFIVDTPIPWGVHERNAGGYDWSKERDLAAFLDQVSRAGMYAMVRPGPCVGGELAHAGLPARVLSRRDHLALTAGGMPVWLPAMPRMFPLPSHASALFRDEVAAWFGAVGEIVAPRLAPDGPVIAVQTGHEAELLARLGPFEHDYHPDALAWWHALGHGEPPRAWDPDDAERCAAWVQFREVYLARTLDWLGAALDAASVRGIARIHDLPWADPGTAGLPGSTDVQAALGPDSAGGMRISHRVLAYETWRRRALYLAGAAEPLPYAQEVPVGGPAWSVPIPDAGTGAGMDPQSSMLGLLAAGVRGLGLSMAVARDRWYGAPISEQGTLRDHAGWLQRLLAALAEVGWTGLRRETPVAVIACRVDAGFALASSVAGPMLPLLDAAIGPGLRHGAALGRDADAMAQRSWLEAVERALALAQVPYVIVDQECPVERLARFRAVVVPTLDRVPRATWRRLRALANRGVVVVLGPGKPTRDEHGRSLGSDGALPTRAGLIRRESIDDLEGLADDLAELAGELPDAVADLWLAAEQADVDCSLFVDQAGAPRVLFVGNRADEDVIADVIVPGGTVLVEPLTDHELMVEGDTVDIALEPQQVRMFLIG